MSIAFAYVRYSEDKVCKIVSSRDIKDFNPKHEKDFDVNKTYDVFWAPEGDTAVDDEGYFEARILKLGVSKESLSKEIEKKRVSIKKVLDVSDVDDPGQGLTEQKKKSKALAKQTVQIKTDNAKKNMQSMLKIKLAARKTNSPTVISGQSGETNIVGLDGDASKKNIDHEDCKSELAEQKWKIKKQEEKIFKLERELRHSLQDNSDRGAEIKAALGDNEALMALNRRLQKQLLNRLEDKSNMTHFQKVNPSEACKDYQPVAKKQCYGESTSSTIVFDPIADDNDPSICDFSTPSYAPVGATRQHIELTPSPKCTSQERERAKKIKPTCSQALDITPARPMTNHDKLSTKSSSTSPLPVGSSEHVDLGSGLTISLNKWKDISCPSNNDSQFIKKLGVAVWGDSVLAKRTVGGNPANARKSNPLRFPALTPEKVMVLKEQLRDRLKKQHGNNLELVAEKVKHVTKYLNEKCNTLRRSKPDTVNEKVTITNITDDTHREMDQSTSQGIEEHIQTDALQDQELDEKSEEDNMV